MLNGKRIFQRLAEFYKTDHRRHVRLPAEYRATLTGPTGNVLVTGVDVHRDGAGVQSPEALPLGSLVFLRIHNLGLMGFAHVRHCSARADGFLLGLQFREGLSRDRQDLGQWSVASLAQNGCRLWDEAEA
jgi:hypothetical protein